MDAILPMNTGAEAVETAIKTARKWGYRVKGVPEGRAKIIVVHGNFHGRTTTIISFSDDPVARSGFGPYTPGFVSVPYGDAVALRRRSTSTRWPSWSSRSRARPACSSRRTGYLIEVRRVHRANVLMIADEIQSGLGRTGKTFACDHEGVVPDTYILGKALGGGIMPVSAVVARSDVMGVFQPGEHGSTFGGNPLACAVGIEVVRMLATGEPQARARELGLVLRELLDALPAHRVSGVRARAVGRHRHRGRTGRDVCEGLMRRGVLAKDTHGATIRLAPPIVIKRADLEWAIGRSRRAGGEPNSGRSRHPTSCQSPLGGALP